MKKIMLTAVLAIALCLSMTGSLFAAPNGLQMAAEIKAIAAEDKNVKDSACIVFSGTCGVALKCGDMYFQQDKNALKAGLIQKIKEKYPDLKNIMVKCDMEIYQKTKKVEDKLTAGASPFSLRGDIMEILRLCESRE